MKHPYTSALILAAGSSLRMQGIDKMMLMVGGKTVLEHTLARFSASQTVDEIVVVCSPAIKDFAQTLSIPQKHSILLGGKTRQQSVCAGMRAVSAQAQFVAIHDGARPFVSPGLIDRVAEAAYACGGAIPGISVSDTVKRVDGQKAVKETLDRASLVFVQTPQIFSRVKFQAFLQAAQRDYTDDSQLFEQNGEAVCVVPGEATNIKITTPADAAFAEELFRRLS